MSHTCRVCANGEGNRTFHCGEKMFGMGDEFVYFQCARCGCLQIASVPENLDRYYPPNYYSFHLQPVSRRGLKAWLAGRRDGAQLTGTAGLGWLLTKRNRARPDVASLARLPLHLGMRILDVGCGRGQLLSVLHRAGFHHLLGIDPFLPTDVEVLPGLTVRKKALEDVHEQFDLIMFHHVFEHIEDGHKILLAARQLLRPQGKILLRIPTADSVAWERYQENWVQLDAPRHFCLHTRSSLTLLVSQAGLAIERCWCDASAFQFWGSELYRLGFSLIDGKGQPALPEDHFTPEQMRRFDLETQALNAAGRGDQLVVILTHAGR